MKSIPEIIKELESDNSRLAKEAILKREIDNELLKQFFVLALDPFINFYIRKMPESKSQTYLTTNMLNNKIQNAFSFLIPIYQRNITGNAAINHLKNILSALNLDDQDIIRRIIKKSPDCGVSESTVNKIWPKLIPEYPCMLCSTFEEKLLKKIKYPAYFQVKEDGMRVNAIVRDKTVEFRSRNGKLLDLMGKLDETFIDLAAGEDVVFDGELLVYEKNGKPMNRQKGNGICQKTGKGTVSEAEAEMIGCVLWDVIPYNVFLGKETSKTYQKRYFELKYRMESLNYTPNKIKKIPTFLVNNMEDVQGYLEDFLEKGMEGGILKDFGSIWEDKRSLQQIKFKGELECDLLCTGWNEGSGKYKGMLGALTCQSKDGKIVVDVGSGFKEYHRKEIGKEVIGKIISVKYNCRIKDKKSEFESLFLPVFLEVRDDKSEPDLSKDIR